MFSFTIVRLGSETMSNNTFHGVAIYTSSVPASGQNFEHKGIVVVNEVILILSLW